ncbi:hypothetical protein AV530_016505 [Patagioenas fasciata monilis]|uniref:Uncharacterized protein n=1 Tax=Patagioenas fasciata monilis TaxID=372326 RepID=A0A1V4J2S5_PATFA|nr:hypothetical protein AV530_016505 [Patagioenas fasciata monilis]
MQNLHLQQLAFRYTQQKSLGLQRPGVAQEQPLLLPLVATKVRSYPRLCLSHFGLQWKHKMAFSNHTNSSSVTPDLFHMFVEQKKTLRFTNFSNPALELQEEIMASFYILIIVGFFGFLLFVMMLSNIVSSKPENYIDYLYSGKLNLQRSNVELPGKEIKDTFIAINSAALLELQRQDGKNHSGPEAPNKDAVPKNV